METMTIRETTKWESYFLGRARNKKEKVLLLLSAAFLSTRQLRSYKSNVKFDPPPFFFHKLVLPNNDLKMYCLYFYHACWLVGTSISHLSLTDSGSNSKWPCETSFMRDENGNFLVVEKRISTMKKIKCFLLNFISYCIGRWITIHYNASVQETCSVAIKS